MDSITPTTADPAVPALDNGARSQFFAPLKQIDASYPQGIFQNRLAPGFSMARHPVLA
jgi:hypothetical protein